MNSVSFRVLTSTETDAIKFDNRYGARELVCELKEHTGFFREVLSMTVTPYQIRKLINGLNYLLKDNNTLIYHLDNQLIFQLTENISKLLINEELDKDFVHNLTKLDTALKAIIFNEKHVTLEVIKS